MLESSKRYRPEIAALWLCFHVLLLAALGAVEVPLGYGVHAALEGSRGSPANWKWHVRGNAEDGPTHVNVRIRANEVSRLDRSFRLDPDELLDISLSDNLPKHSPLRTVRNILRHTLWRMFEQMGLFFTGVLFCAFLWTQDPAKRRWIPAFVAASILTGIAVIGLKWLTGKIRPEAYFNPLSEFQGILFVPFLKARSIDAPVCFPSGHAAQAFVTAAFFGRLYPRARWLLFGAAALAALSRLTLERHWLSDAYAGAVVGFHLTQGCLRVFQRALPGLAGSSGEGSPS